MIQERFTILVVTTQLENGGEQHIRHRLSAKDVLIHGSSRNLNAVAMTDGPTRRLHTEMGRGGRESKTENPGRQSRYHAEM